MLYVVALRDIPITPIFAPACWMRLWPILVTTSIESGSAGRLLRVAEDHIAGGILILEAEFANQVMEIVRADP